MVKVLCRKWRVGKKCITLCVVFCTSRIGRSYYLLPPHLSFIDRSTVIVLQGRRVNSIRRGPVVNCTFIIGIHIILLLQQQLEFDSIRFDSIDVSWRSPLDSLYCCLRLVFGVSWMLRLRLLLPLLSVMGMNIAQGIRRVVQVSLTLRWMPTLSISVHKHHAILAVSRNGRSVMGYKPQTDFNSQVRMDWISVSWRPRTFQREAQYSWYRSTWSSRPLNGKTCCRTRKVFVRPNRPCNGTIWCNITVNSLSTCTYWVKWRKGMNLPGTPGSIHCPEFFTMELPWRVSDDHSEWFMAFFSFFFFIFYRRAQYSAPHHRATVQPFATNACPPSLRPWRVNHVPRWRTSIKHCNSSRTRSSRKRPRSIRNWPTGSFRLWAPGVSPRPTVTSRFLPWQIWYVWTCNDTYRRHGWLMFVFTYFFT